MADIMCRPAAVGDPPLDRYGRPVTTWLTADGEPPCGDSGKPPVFGRFDADGNYTLAPPARQGR